MIRTYTTANARRGCVVVGVLFAIAVVAGGELYRTNTLSGLWASPAAALANLALTVVVAAAAAAVALAAFALQRRLEENPPRSTPALLASPAATAIAAVMLFCCWLPCLLAYWPGLLTYDIPTQTDFVFEGDWTTQQPPLHTLIWAVFLQLQGVCSLEAITWYSFAQMAFLAVVFANVLAFLARRKVALVLRAIAAAFFALNPVVALFAITPVKDTLLAGVLTLVIMGLAQFIGDPRGFTRSKVRCVGLIVGLAVCCLLRENMLVAVAVFAVVALIALKSNRKAVAVLCGAPLALALIVIGPVYALADISAGSSAIASVPIQQVANVVRLHEDELSDEDMAIVNAVLPADELADSYNPRFADTTVRLFKGRHSDLGGMRESIMAFLGLWASFIPRYPLDMLDAFAALNVPYWYPFSQTPDPFSERDYIETSIWKESKHYTVEPASLAPGLRGAYERVADYSALNNPVAGIVFSPSSAIWIILTTTYLLFCSRRRNAMLVVLPLLFWLSFLIGPVSNMRYMFPLFCLYPMLIAAALQPGRVLTSGEAPAGRIATMNDGNRQVQRMGRHSARQNPRTPATAPYPGRIPASNETTARQEGLEDGRKREARTGGIRRGNHERA